MTGTPNLRLLHAAVFMSSFDRGVIAPILLVVAADLGEPVSGMAAAATVYLFAYGSTQLVWGVVSDRLGRIRTIRIALSLGAAGALLSALAPSVAVLILARGLAGAAFSAIVPGVLIYIGDSVPPHARHRQLSDVMTSTAVGLSAATLVGAGLADLLSWRFTFALPGVLVIGVAIALGRLPEPSTKHRRDVTARRALGTVMRNRWALLVLILALVEGAVLLGVLTYLPAVLQDAGMGTTASGAVAASYGVSVIVFARAVGRLSRTVSTVRLMAIGAAMGVLAYVMLVVDQATLGVFSGSVLLAGAYAFLHSSLQKWVIGVVPEARATVVSLFASALFLGSAAGTAFGAGYVAAGDTLPYFAVGLAVMVMLSWTVLLTRTRYRGE